MGPFFTIWKCRFLSRKTGFQIPGKSGETLFLKPVLKPDPTPKRARVELSLDQRFSAYFVLKFAFQRGEGEKREGCKFQNKAHRTFHPRINSTPVQYPYGLRRGGDVVIRRSLNFVTGVIKFHCSFRLLRQLIHCFVVDGRGRGRPSAAFVLVIP